MSGYRVSWRVAGCAVVCICSALAAAWIVLVVTYSQTLLGAPR